MSNELRNSINDGYNDEDRAYFLRRAEWHRARADDARESGTRDLHLQFVSRYRARCQS